VCCVSIQKGTTFKIKRGTKSLLFAVHSDAGEYDVCRLDERKRRKEFIIERNLLYPNPFEKDLSQEEKVQCRRLDVFMRFHSKEEHDELLRNVVSEYRMVKRLKDLKVRTLLLSNCAFGFLDWMWLTVLDWWSRKLKWQGVVQRLKQRGIWGGRGREKTKKG